MIAAYKLLNWSETTNLTYIQKKIKYNKKIMRFF